MNFIKSNFAKKIIIVLIVIITFNAVVPPQVHADDIAGLLIKGVSKVVLGILIIIDVALGAFILTKDLTLTEIGDIAEHMNNQEEHGEEINDQTKIETIIEGGNEGKDLLLRSLFIGPDTIFSGVVSMLDANIFKATVPANGNEAVDLIGTIKKGISTTYVLIQNICAILMLIGLIFTGIKILITTNIPSKRSMWLDMIQDWVIGMFFLIFSHFIMILVFSISDKLTEALSKTLTGFGGLNFSLILKCIESYDAAEQIICLVMCGYLIYLTVFFAIAYFKRLMWVCVLIVIAPVVSVMYAFGSQTKQIYTKWFKEYLTTVLIQPFHLIVYTVLISIPVNMVRSTNSAEIDFGAGFLLEVIYALIALSFIRPAEKYIRELFGMGQGIAGMAAFDSGKQTWDSIKTAFENVSNKAMLAMSIPGLGGRWFFRRYTRTKRS